MSVSLAVSQLQMALAAQNAAPPAAKDAPAATASLAASLAQYLDSLLQTPPWVSIVIARLILVGATLAMAWLGLKLLRYLIMVPGKRLLEARLGGGGESRGRAETLSQLFFSMAKYVVYFMAFVTALYQASINPAPFLGGAAVVGLAVGFGSQDLVKDVVTGIFILIENQFTIGEYVDLGGKSGIVKGMSVRRVTVRDDAGRLHNLPYRSINVVTNFSRGGTVLFVDVFLGEAADEKRASEALEKLAGQLSDELSGMVRTFSLEGVLNAGTAQSLVRLCITARPSRAAFVQEQLLARIKDVFAAASIVIKSDIIRVYPALQAGS